MRKIKVTSEQWIDSGSYGAVYRISKTKVVKAFFNHPYMEEIIRDEIRGSKLFKAALPILEVVTVVLPDDKETVGLIKRYIPYSVTNKEMLEATRKKEITYSWDRRADNFRKDKKGRIWMIDTQTVAADELYRKKYDYVPCPSCP
jgi:hypothetical protein